MTSLADIDNAKWVQAEAEFNLLSRATLATRAKHNQPPLRLLERIPFKRQALALAESVSSEQAAANLELEALSCDRVDYAALCFLFGLSLRRAGLIWGEPALVQQFPDLAGRRRLEEAMAAIKTLNDSVDEQLLSAGIDPDTLEKFP